MMSENNEKLVQENALVVTERDHCSKQIAELRQEKEEYEQIIARQREYIEEMTEKCTRIEESKS